MDKTKPQKQQQPPPPSHGSALPPAKGLQTPGLPPLHQSGTSSSASLLPSQLDLEDLVPLDPSSAPAYTSLEDLLPSAAVSSSAYGRDISARHRLAKQSGWVSPPPVTSSSSSNSAGTNFIRRLWLHVSSGNPFSACVARAMSFINGSIIPGITRAINRILQSIRV